MQRQDIFLTAKKIHFCIWKEQIIYLPPAEEAKKHPYWLLEGVRTAEMLSLTLHNRINREGKFEYYVPCLQTNKKTHPNKKPTQNPKAHQSPNKTHNILQNKAEY